MKVVNVHERELDAAPEEVGALLDSLASPEDALWPIRSWPPMKFDQGLVVGAVGGHGPIGYVVEHYSPGQQIRFRFTRPEGFQGTHEFEVVSAPGNRVLLRHRIEARLRADVALAAGTSNETATWDHATW